MSFSSTGCPQRLQAFQTPERLVRHSILGGVIGKAYLDMEAVTNLSDFFARAAILARNPDNILEADLMGSERK